MTAAAEVTVCCVFVQGHVNFTAEYVVRLRSMVRKRLARQHRFVVLTDQPSKIPSDMAKIEIPTPTVKAWWSKVRLFDPGLPLSGRCLYLDLDTLPVADLDPIVDFDARFALAPHAGTFEGKNGLRVVKRFNSSVMVWNAGDNIELYLDWHESVAKVYWGDQDWIGLKADDTTKAMPLEWFPRLSELIPPAVSSIKFVTPGQPEWPEAAKVILCKRPKNHEAAEMWPWFGKVWQ